MKIAISRLIFVRQAQRRRCIEARSLISAASDGAMLRRFHTRAPVAFTADSPAGNTLISAANSSTMPISWIRAR